MTTTCAECRATCSLHNVTACATCHRHANECSFGACRRRPTHTVTHMRNGAPVSVMRACTMHATDGAYDFLRSGAVVERVAAPRRRRSTARARAERADDMLDGRGER